VSKELYGRHSFADGPKRTLKAELCAQCIKPAASITTAMYAPAEGPLMKTLSGSMSRSATKSFTVCGDVRRLAIVPPDPGGAEERVPGDAWLLYRRLSALVGEEHVELVLLRGHLPWRCRF